MTCTWVGEGVDYWQPLVLDRGCMCVDGNQSQKAKQLGIACHCVKFPESCNQSSWSGLLRESRSGGKSIWLSLYTYADDVVNDRNPAFMVMPHTIASTVVNDVQRRCHQLQEPYMLPSVCLQVNAVHASACQKVNDTCESTRKRSGP
jgi:hypothetical protein